MRIVKELSDQQLLEYCRLGNDKAFDVLFNKYFNRLYQLTLKFIKNTETAEELVMDLMMWIWENRTNNFCVDGDFGAYLYKAMRNSIISYYRKKTLQTEPIELVHEENMAGSRHADYNQRDKELDNCYQQKLGELSLQRRTVYQLSRDQEMSYTEIAEKLNLSKNTVKSHMTFSLSHLRNSLEPHL